MLSLDFINRIYQNKSDIADQTTHQEHFGGTLHLTLSVYTSVNNSRQNPISKQVLSTSAPLESMAVSGTKHLRAVCNDLVNQSLDMSLSLMHISEILQYIYYPTYKGVTVTFKNCGILALHLQWLHPPYRSVKQQQQKLDIFISASLDRFFKTQEF